MNTGSTPVAQGSSISLDSVHHFPEGNYSFNFLSADSDFKRDFEFSESLAA